MKRVFIYKIFSRYDYSYEDTVELISRIADPGFVEVSDLECTEIGKKIENFNRFRHRLNPQPDFSLAYFEEVLPESLDSLMEQTYELAKLEETANQKRKESADKAAEKRKLGEIERKRKQLEKLKTELGEK